MWLILYTRWSYKIYSGVFRQVYVPLVHYHNDVEIKSDIDFRRLRIDIPYPDY
jgi:hypothetical protein